MIWCLDQDLNFVGSDKMISTVIYLDILLFCASKCFQSILMLKSAKISGFQKKLSEPTCLLKC